MIARGVALALVLLLTGCTQVIHDARPRAQAPVAPITGSQVGDLLSEDAAPDEDPNPFVTVVPEECAGVTREVEHTAVQWNSAASQRCAVLSELRAAGGDSSRSRSCPRISDSIKHAVAEGCLEESCSAPSPSDG